LADAEAYSFRIDWTPFCPPCRIRNRACTVVKAFGDSMSE
jgi:hypothetical protein